MPNPSSGPTLRACEIHFQVQSGALALAGLRAHALNAVFYEVLGLRDLALADAVHAAQGPAPFALAPLFDADGLVGLRVTTLTAALGQAVAEAWGGLAATGGTVRLGAARLTVAEARPGQPTATSCAELLARVPSGHGVRLAFETPVRWNLRHGACVMPTPRLLWQGYVQRWEAYGGGAPLPPEFLRWVENAVYVSDLALQVGWIPMERSVEWKGALGELECHAYTDDVPTARASEYLRAWQALARLGEFCGSGEKPTMGLGRTRVVKSFGWHRE